MSATPTLVLSQAPEGAVHPPHFAAEQARSDAHRSWRAEACRSQSQRPLHAPQFAASGALHCTARAALASREPRKSRAHDRGAVREAARLPTRSVRTRTCARGSRRTKSPCRCSDGASSWLVLPVTHLTFEPPPKALPQVRDNGDRDRECLGQLADGVVSFTLDERQVLLHPIIT